MYFSIIIPTHKRHHSLVNLLDSIDLQNYSKDQFEVIVVSNLKDRQLEKIIENKKYKFSHKVKNTGKIGVNLARNLGVVESIGSHLYFLDDDCILDLPDHLFRVEKVLEENKEVTSVGGPYHLPKNHSDLDYVYNSICRQWLEKSVRKSGFTINLVGGNMVYRKSIFSSGYQFNNEIKFGGSETELNARLIQNGFRLKYDPSISVEHNCHLSLTEFSKKSFWQGYGAAKRKLNGIQQDSINCSIFDSCSRNSSLIDFYLLIYDHYFQIGWNSAMTNSKQKPNIPIVINSLWKVSQKEFNQKKMKDWMKSQSFHL